MPNAKCLRLYKNKPIKIPAQVEEGSRDNLALAEELLAIDRGGGSHVTLGVWPLVGCLPRLQGMTPYLRLTQSEFLGNAAKNVDMIRHEG